MTSAEPTRAPSREAYWIVSVWSNTKPNSSIAKQQERERGHQEGELDQALAALVASPSQPAHRIGSMRMEFDWVRVKPGAALAAEAVAAEPAERRHPLVAVD